jgi:hypothetical protein
MSKRGRRILSIICIACFVLGVGLMVPFEATITRLLGMAFLVAFVVTGVFVLADPRRLRSFN